MTEDPKLIDESGKWELSLRGSVRRRGFFYDCAEDVGDYIVLDIQVSGGLGWCDNMSMSQLLEKPNPWDKLKYDLNSNPKALIRQSTDGVKYF